MKVGIDISSLVYDRGVSRYTANLVRALLDQEEVNLALYGYSLRQFRELQTQAKELCGQKKCRLAIQKMPPAMMSWLWKFSLHGVKKQLPKLDVFHSWDWLQPPDKDLPLVSTIHDLAILKFPEIASPGVVRNHHKSWHVLKQRQAQIIAVSRSTKKDLVEFLDFDPSRITVIYEALPMETHQTALATSDEQFVQLKTKLKLDKPYIFFVGTREPRKNLSRLIKAWQPLASEYELIIAGAQGGDETTKLAKTKQSALRFLGQVTNQELGVLYSEASLFAYPSLYEGFGLPILESFYHGTPVVTSNISSMPEVAGNAAELVDPNSIESIRQGLEKVLGESHETQKKRLQQMIIRLQMFSWQKVAKQTVQVYDRALEKP